MSNIDSVRQKVQRILTKNLNNVRVDKDGNFSVTHESANLFIKVFDAGNENIILELTCPMVKDVKLTNELYKWVATEGQSNRFGSSHVVEIKPGYGAIVNEQCLVANDLDESELMANVIVLLRSSADLDTELQGMFGGELFGED